MNVEARINQFKNMAQADPDNELGHFSLGKAYLDASRFGDAEPCFARVIELNATHSKAHQLLGQAMLELGRKEDAIAILKRGCEVAGERGDVMPRDEMARMLSELGETAPTVELKTAESATVAADSTGFRCTRCGRPHGRLDERPFKGEMGEKILKCICADCWSEWVSMGTKVINEMSLQLADPKHQVTYDEYMREFLQLDE